MAIPLRQGLVSMASFTRPIRSKSLPLRCATCAAVIRDKKNAEILGKFTQFAKVQCSKCRKLPNPSHP